MPKVLLVALGLWVLWAVRRRVRQRRHLLQRAAELGLAPGLEPTDEELALHWPVDEATLRSAKVGVDVERIVALYRNGHVARGAVLEMGAVDERRGPTTTATTFFSVYGWFDHRGALRVHRSHETNSGLLNRHFDLRRPSVLLVAYDPRSRDHVLVYGLGGRAQPSLSEPLPQPTQVAPEVLASKENVLAAVSLRFDDTDALRIMADRLLELGDPRGELMAMQLSRASDAAPLPTEEALIRRNLAQWVAPGVGLVHFKNGFAVECTWLGPTDPTHAMWQTIETLTCSMNAPGPTAFEAPMPRLKSVRNMTVYELARARPWLSGVEALAFGPGDFNQQQRETVFRELAQLGSLRVLDFRLQEGQLLLLHWAKTGLPRLQTLRLSAAELDPREVQTALTPQLTVDLVVSGDHVSRESEVWVRLTRRAMTLHRSGTLDAHGVVKAKRLLATCGIKDPPILVESRGA